MTTTFAPEAKPAVELGPPTSMEDCDRCGYSQVKDRLGERIAQAFVRVVLKSGRQLTFCKHHADKYAPALAEAGAQIIDGSDRINAKPSVSANAD